MPDVETNTWKDCQWDFKNKDRRRETISRIGIRGEKRIRCITHLVQHRKGTIPEEEWEDDRSPA